MTGVLGLWLRLDLRRRWRATVVLVLLVAISTAVVLATVAGARRTSTALPRLTGSIAPATVMVLPNQDGFDWDKVRALPTVKALGTFVLTHGDGPQGVGFDASEIVGFPPGDRSEYVDLDTPKLLSGRLPDPNNPSEIVATPGFTAKYGSNLAMRLPSAAQERKVRADSSPPGTRYTGPTIHLHVVGVGVNTFNLGPGGGPVFSVDYAFFKRYIDPYFPHFANARVVLRGGEAAIPTFTRQLAAATGDPGIEIDTERDMESSVRRAATFTAQAWLLFSLASLLAAVVLVGQAFVRFTAASTDDLRSLAALGLDRRQSRLLAAAGSMVAAVLGVAAGVGGAVLLSTWFPTGLARSYEPQPGIRGDALVLGAGAAVLLVIALAGAWLCARRAVSTTAQPVDRRSMVATTVTRLGLGVPVVLGTRFALEPGRGRTRVSVRPALIGAVAGVLGVVGALTFRSGLDSTVNDYSRFGQAMTGFGFVSEGAPPPGYAGALRQAAHDPDLSVLDDMRVDVFVINGRPTTTFRIAPVVGTVPIIAAGAGHSPQTANEVSLGPSVAALLHVHAGDTVNVAGTSFVVSGISYVPQDPHSDYTDGAWLTKDAFDALQPDLSKDKFHEIRFNVKPGVDFQTAMSRLPKGLAPGGIGLISQAFPIDQQVELRSVRLQPLLLGGFLVVLALGAVGHGLATAVRRRRHDVAVLRALGMTRRQARLIIVVQATVLALVGLLLGIPLGIAAGRASWQWLAAATPVVYIAPLAAVAVYLAFPVAVAVANALAAWPARRAARLRVADVLRAE